MNIISYALLPELPGASSALLRNLRNSSKAPTERLWSSPELLRSCLKLPWSAPKLLRSSPNSRSSPELPGSSLGAPSELPGTLRSSPELPGAIAELCRRSPDLSRSSSGNSPEHPRSILGASLPVPPPVHKLHKYLYYCYKGHRCVLLLQGPSLPLPWVHFPPSRARSGLT